MPLRFLVKTAITVVTPPVVSHSVPLPVTHLFAVRRNHRGVADSGHDDPIELQLRIDGGATAIIGGITGVLAAALRGQ